MHKTPLAETGTMPNAAQAAAMPAGMPAAASRAGNARRRTGLFGWPRVVRRFRHEEDGVTAVEFAILAGPFFFLLMAIIESSLLFFAGQVLESSVDDVARQIRTGQLDETLTQNQLRTEICNASAVLFDCDDLNIDMQVVATFSDLGDMPEPNSGAIDPADRL